MNENQVTDWLLGKRDFPLYQDNVVVKLPLRTNNKLFTGWNREMLKLPSQGKVRKIEVNYVNNNGDPDMGIQDCWDIFVSTPKFRKLIKEGF